MVAERACTRAFIDLLMERQAGSEGFFGNHVTDPPPITTDQITSMVSKQNSLVLCFSVAAGFLYSWLLTPRDGKDVTLLIMLLHFECVFSHLLNFQDSLFQKGFGEIFRVSNNLNTHQAQLP